MSSAPYIASVSVISLQRAMEYSPNFSLNCTSTGSPATTVTWRRDGMVLSRGGQYEMTQILLNGATATYVNILVVSGTPSSLRGVYSCDIWNGIGTATMNITINGKYFVCVRCRKYSLIIYLSSIDSFPCPSSIPHSFISHSLFSLSLVLTFPIHRSLMSLSKYYTQVCRLQCQMF